MRETAPKSQFASQDQEDSTNSDLRKVNLNSYLSNKVRPGPNSKQNPTGANNVPLLKITSLAATESFNPQVLKLAHHQQAQNNPTNNKPSLNPPTHIQLTNHQPSPPVTNIKKKNEPNPPKKPNSAFLVFLTQHREKLGKKGLSPDEAGEKAVKMWRNTSPAVKQKYENVYKKKKIKYEADLAKYNDRLRKKHELEQQKKGEIFAFLPSGSEHFSNLKNIIFIISQIYHFILSGYLSKLLDLSCSVADSGQWYNIGVFFICSF